MQRIDILTVTTLSLMLLALSATVALANEDGSVGSGTQGGVGATVQVRGVGVGSGQSDDSEVRTNANAGVDVGDDSADDRLDDSKGKSSASASTSSSAANGDQDSNKEAGDSEESEGEQHRSSVANIVQSLISLASKDRNIGDEIRTVAQEQASASEESSDAMVKVEARNALLTFLFGSDYKNLGVLRSTLATTQNHIDRLTKARGRAISSDIKAGIDAQISALQKANADAEAFVNAHEQTFSLFGWFTKLFQ